ncbi:hypothetical protein Aduo_018276 [Ancylostoma duodenale]
MTDNPLGNEGQLRAESPEAKAEGSEESGCGNGIEIHVTAAPQEVIQRQVRLLTRVKRDMRALLEKIDNNTFLLNNIVYRLEVIERKLNDFLESRGNFEANASYTNQINGISEEH